MKPLQFDYSPNIDALRIAIQEGEFNDTIEIAEGLFVDLDEGKNILAIEMLHASRLLNAIRN